MKRKLIKYFLLLIILVTISFSLICIYGKTYTVKNDNHVFDNIDKYNITANNDDVLLLDKKINNGVLELKYKSNKKGKTLITIEGENYLNIVVLYVNRFGVITEESKFGNCSFDEVIPISISIFLMVLIIDLIKKEKSNIKQNLYQYKNIFYFSLIIFLSFALVGYIVDIFNYRGLYYTLEGFTNNVSGFSMLLFPIALVTFILVTISNIKLVIKEGFSVKNLLGVLLGIFLCLLTLLPDFLYRFTYSSNFIDIHRYGSVDSFIYNFIETFIYLIVSYLECVLIGTIYISIKAAKRIPEFNQDYIIILGCMINKDGSLTNLLKGRVDKAIEFSKMQKERTNKDITFITSGGKGNDEPISEGLAMKNYLVKNKIDENRIIVEDKSTDTFENFKFSMKKIKNKKNVAYSTTNFHVFRAGVEASKLGLNVEGIGSKTKRYFWINAFIREFIATIYYERKNHLIIFGMILLINALMILILYISTLF